MRKLSFTLCLGMAVAALSAQTLTRTLYLDFGKSDGTNGSMTEAPDANGHYWNNIVSTESGSPSTKPAGYAVQLVDADNASTGFTLTTTEAFKANGRNNGGLLDPDPALLGDLAVGTATEDYFFIESAMNDKGAFILSGLDPARAYKFVLFGSREGTDNRTAVYSISGLNGSHGTLTATGTGGAATNDRNLFTSDYVVPKADGTIMVEMGILSGGFAYINAMKMEEYEGYALPQAERTLYIDFGKNNNGLDGTPTTSPDANGHYWNNMYSNGDGPTTEQAGKTLPLVWSDNTPSGARVELGTNFEFNGVRNGGLTDPDPALLGDLGIATATQDYIFRSGDNIEGTILFKGLNPQKMYRFQAFGSRYEAGGNRIGFFTFSGSNSIMGLHQMGGKNMAGTDKHQNVANIFVSDPIVPDADSTVTFTLKEWLGNFFHVNAMKIEEITATDYATSISISGPDAIDQCGQVGQYMVTALPEGAFCPAVVWSVDDETKAEVTAEGKFYALADGTVTLTATASLPDGTALTDLKQVVISRQAPGEYVLAVMGSSVPYGQGAESGKGYAQLWASYLSGQAVNSWSTTNISVPGNNTTDVMNRWDNDLLPVCSRYVYYGLSLGNEGVHERGQAAFDSYRDNMLTLIERARRFGKVPLVGNNYTRADFNASDYNYVKQLNLLIHEWDVPSVNLLGAIDDGQGRWASGYQADNAHPNTAGHAELFYAIVPSLMDALAAGKAQPVRAEGTSLTLAETDGQAQVVAWQPENVLHSFTLTFSFRTTGTGGLATFDSEGLTGTLLLDADGTLDYSLWAFTSDEARSASSAALNDGQWHTVSLTHYYAWGRTFLYVDGVQQGDPAEEKLVPTAFTLHAADGGDDTVEYRELYFHRAGMNAEEIAALHAGRLLKSSLEIYAPLDGTASTDEAKLENRAQSLNTLALESREAGNTGLHEVPGVAGLREVSVYTMAGVRLLTVPGNAWLSTREALPQGLYIVRLADTAGQVSVQKIAVE